MLPNGLIRFECKKDRASPSINMKRFGVWVFISEIASFPINLWFSFFTPFSFSAIFCAVCQVGATGFAARYYGMETEGTRFIVSWHIIPEWGFVMSGKDVEGRRDLTHEVGDSFFIIYANRKKAIRPRLLISVSALDGLSQKPFVNAPKVVEKNFGTFFAVIPLPRLTRQHG